MQKSFHGAQVKLPRGALGTGGLYMVGNRDIFLDRTMLGSYTLQLNHCGIQKCVPGYTWGFAMRPYHLIHFVWDGKGTLYTNKKTYNLRKGQAFYIPVGASGSYQADPVDPWLYSWIGFYADSRSPLPGRLFGAGNILDLAIPLPELEQLFLSIISVTDRRLCGLETYRETDFPGECFFPITEFPKSLEANSRMLHLFSRLLETQEEVLPPSLKGINPACDARAYIDACYSEPVKIQDIARALHVHPNYLCTVFKKTYGQSPGEYLRTIRMEHAAMLLHLTSHPVSAVAQAVGYTNPLQFSTAFKSHYHVPPTVYRKQSR